jgi:SAM-dependent methyltransferase
MNMLFGVPVVQVIGLAAQLGIPTQLKEGARSAAELAEACGTLPDPTYRVLRALGSLGVLNEHPERRFSLTPVGECLVPGRPGSFDALAQLYGAPWSHSAFSQMLQSLKTGQSSFSLHYGESLFSWLGKHPTEQELFGRAMSTFSGMELGLVLGAHDFSAYRQIVDVGGGHGSLLAAILRAAPEASGTLFDLAPVIEFAQSSINAAGLATRCRCVSGDFFAHAPAGGDLYLLKHVLHDWDDARANRILSNVARAMSPGARLLIIEQGVSPPGVPGPGKLLDVVMLAMLEGGRERSADELSVLCERAGLHFEGEITTPGPITLFSAARE